MFGLGKKNKPFQWSDEKISKRIFSGSASLEATYSVEGKTRTLELEVMPKGGIIDPPIRLHNDSIDEFLTWLTAAHSSE